MKTKKWLCLCGMAVGLAMVLAIPAVADPLSPTDPVEQYKLGVKYMEGTGGVAQDYAQAAYWYRKAAEQGNAKAQNNLGWMYANGRGVTQNAAEAVRWYRKAAEQGNAAAQNNLGVMYDRGLGVTRDDVEAVRWYRKAAEQGYAKAQYWLGVMYATGEGVAQDDVEAVRWYRKAAEQGDDEAQSNLGNRYLNGITVAKDDAEAERWHRKAQQGAARRPLQYWMTVGEIVTDAVTPAPEYDEPAPTPGGIPYGPPPPPLERR